MPDIPMLQPASKTERSGATPTKETTSGAEKDASTADFDAAYSSEAEGKTDQSSVANSRSPEEVAENVSTQPADPENEANSTKDADDIAMSGSAPTLVDEEALAPDVAMLTDQDTLEQPGIEKAKTDTKTWAFSQLLTRNVSPASPEQSIGISGTETRSIERSFEASSLPGSIGGITDSNSKKLSQNSEMTQKINLATPLLEDRDTLTSQLGRAVETISQTAKQATAASAQSQQQQLSTSKLVLHPDAEKSSERTVRHDIDEASKYSAETTTRMNPKAAMAFQAPLTAPSITSPQNVMPLSVQKEALGLDTALTAVGDAEAPVAWDARASAPPATLAQTIARPDTPAMIGRQMAEILQRMPDRPVELMLNPEELGRVRMSISAGDAGITVSVLAERPETLDLMRRHIDQLAREFQALGYANINFAFNEGQSDQSAQGKESPPDGNGSKHSVPDTAVEAVDPIRLVASSGVDLRL
ncbi:MAG: flagellar hook-length control protein FliK [Paracoccaceae bacterium]|nr:flagellar hook-length control protein FliK [Paracoccaceae bacterium]